MSIRFFDSVSFNNPNKSFKESLMEKVDDYFELSGRKILIINDFKYDGIQQARRMETDQSYLSTAIKVATYFTGVIPLIMLSLKAVLRINFQCDVIADKEAASRIFCSYELSIKEKCKLIKNYCYNDIKFENNRFGEFLSKGVSIEGANILNYCDELQCKYDHYFITAGLRERWEYSTPKNIAKEINAAQLSQQALLMLAKEFAHADMDDRFFAIYHQIGIDWTTTEAKQQLDKNLAYFARRYPGVILIGIKDDPFLNENQRAKLFESFIDADYFDCSIVEYIENFRIADHSMRLHLLRKVIGKFEEKKDSFQELVDNIYRFQIDVSTPEGGELMIKVIVQWASKDARRSRFYGIDEFVEGLKIESGKLFRDRLIEVLFEECPYHLITRMDHFGLDPDYGDDQQALVRLAKKFSSLVEIKNVDFFKTTISHQIEKFDIKNVEDRFQIAKLSCKGSIEFLENIENYAFNPFVEEERKYLLELIHSAFLGNSVDSLIYRITNKRIAEDWELITESQLIENETHRLFQHALALEILDRYINKEFFQKTDRVEIFGDEDLWKMCPLFNQLYQLLSNQLSASSNAEVTIALKDEIKIYIQKNSTLVGFYEQFLEYFDKCVEKEELLVWFVGTIKRIENTLTRGQFSHLAMEMAQTELVLLDLMKITDAQLRNDISKLFVNNYLKTPLRQIPLKQAEQGSGLHSLWMMLNLFCIDADRDSNNNNSNDFMEKCFNSLLEQTCNKDQLENRLETLSVLFRSKHMEANQKIDLLNIIFQYEISKEHKNNLDQQLRCVLECDPLEKIYIDQLLQRESFKDNLTHRYFEMMRELGNCEEFGIDGLTDLFINRKSFSKIIGSYELVVTLENNRADMERVFDDHGFNHYFGNSPLKLLSQYLNTPTVQKNAELYQAIESSFKESMDLLNILPDFRALETSLRSENNQQQLFFWFVSSLIRFSFNNEMFPSSWSDKKGLHTSGKMLKQIMRIQNPKLRFKTTELLLERLWKKSSSYDLFQKVIEGAETPQKVEEKIFPIALYLTALIADVAEEKKSIYLPIVQLVAYRLAHLKSGKLCLTDELFIKDVLITLETLLHTVNLTIEEKISLLDITLKETTKKSELVKSYAQMRGIIFLGAQDKLPLWQEGPFEEYMKRVYQDKFQQMIPVKNLNAEKIDSFLKTFRDEELLIKYAATLNGGNESDVVNLLAQCMEEIIDGSFISKRYSVGEHLSTLFAAHPSLKNLWTQNTVKWVKEYSVSDQQDSQTVNIQQHLFASFDQDHVDKQCYPHLWDYLKAADESTKEAVFKRLSEDKENEVKKFQMKAIELIPLQSPKMQLKGISELMALLPKQGEKAFNLQFSHDINTIKNELENLNVDEDSADWTVVNTDNYVDVFSCGTEIEGSCQRVDGSPGFNKCLLGYVMDGKNRLLAIKDRDGKIKARSIVKLLWDPTAKQAVLFLERTYPRAVKTCYAKIILESAKELAQKLQIPLLTKEAFEGTHYPHDVCSLSSRALFEYDDAAGVGVTNGKFVISGAVENK